MPAPSPDSAVPVGCRRVALAAGGTAGHVYPALAVAEAFGERGAAEVLFIGTADGFEARLVPASTYRFEVVAAAPLFGVGPVGKLRALSEVGIGVMQARRVLRAHRIELVIGFGGYASAAALLAARSLGLRTALHEANVVPGLANRWLGRIVERVYLGSPATASAFRSRPTLVTGYPVRPAVAAVARSVRPAGSPRRVLIVGGSQGAHFLNQHVPDLLARVAANGVALEVRHQVGDLEADTVRTRYAAAGITAGVTAYVEDIAAAYAWADFAITRAGAGTIAELAACALPAMLVPLPSAAGGHQAANAEACAHAGGGWAVDESHWHVTTLAAQLTALLRSPTELDAVASRLRALARPDAAARLVADCEVTFRSAACDQRPTEQAARAM